jgi:hypothetical protein
MLEIHQTMVDVQAEGYASPCPPNGIYFMNHPSHYVLDRPIGLAPPTVGALLFKADHATLSVQRSTL